MKLQPPSNIEAIPTIQISEITHFNRVSLGDGNIGTWVYLEGSFEPQLKQVCEIG